MSETQREPEGHSAVQRPVALVVLLVAGLLSLPVAAAFLDGEDTDDWIIPVAVVAMAVVGAVVGRVLPGLAGSRAAVGRAAGVGAVLGVLMAVLGVLVFAVLLD